MAGKNLAVVGKGPFDAALIEGFSAGRSAETVSEAIGGVLKPVECLARIKELVSALDPLDVPDQLSLLLQDNYYIRNRLKRQFDDKEFLDKDDVGSWLKINEAIVKRIESQSEAFSDKMMQVHEIHARVMVQAIRVSFKAALLELQQRYPEITEQEAYEVLEQAMPVAIKSLNDEVSSG